MKTGEVVEGLPVRSGTVPKGWSTGDSDELVRITELRHPNLLRTQLILEKETGNLLLVEEAADRSLADRLADCQRAGQPGIPADELLGHLIGVAEAIDFLHGHQVHHAGICPANIRLVGGQAKLAEPDLSVNLRKNRLGSIATIASSGPLAYMAPEVFANEFFPASDLFSLAVTYVELRLGRRPFAGSSPLELLLAITQGEPDLGTLLQGEKEALLRALAKDPFKRHANCKEFLEALRRAITNAPLAIQRTEASPQHKIESMRFSLDRKVAAGGFGEVWSAVDPEGGQVVIKALPPVVDTESLSTSGSVIAVAPPGSGTAETPRVPSEAPAAPEGPPQPKMAGSHEPEILPAPRGRGRGGARSTPSRVVQRQATVRYYSRMNPQKAFPLLVAISAKAIRAVIQKAVEQRQSETFHVQAGSVVDIEPVLPGCLCYPPRDQVVIEEKEVSTRFFVVPQVLGAIMEPRVMIRQNGRVLAEVALRMRVVKQTFTLLMGVATLVLPTVSSLLKHYRLDFNTQYAEGFAGYIERLQTLMNLLSPGVLMAGMLVLTSLAYLCLRPRKKTIFWEITPP